MATTFMQKELQTDALHIAVLCLLAEFLVTNLASLFFTLTVNTRRQTRSF